MVKIKQYEGLRITTGHHTSYAIIEHKGKYYVSQESGTRPATKTEIKKIKLEKNINLLKGR